VTTPSVTAAAIAHLAGRPIVLRSSPRNGCCGGRALLPVAEVGTPADIDHYRRVVAGEVIWFIEPALMPMAGVWTVDVLGIGRWRRLHVDGAEPLDPTRA
jgi:hypothetical protein